MITLIGISLFIIGEFVFDQFAPPKSTNWSIFYFSFTYFGMMLICVDQFMHIHSKLGSYVSIVFFAFFAYMTYVELLMINLPYDQYLIAVSDRIINNQIKILTLALLAILTYWAWEKRLSKRS